MSVRDQIEEQVEELKTARDEIQVRLHLAKLEAREAWEGVEKQWEHVEGKLKVLGEATQESVEDVGKAAQLVLDEIREGYERIRKLI